MIRRGPRPGCSFHSVLETRFAIMCRAEEEEKEAGKGACGGGGGWHPHPSAAAGEEGSGARPLVRVFSSAPVSSHTTTARRANCFYRLRLCCGPLIFSGW